MRYALVAIMALMVVPTAASCVNDTAPSSKSPTVVAPQVSVPPQFASLERPLASFSPAAPAECPAASKRQLPGFAPGAGNGPVYAVGLGSGPSAVGSLTGAPGPPWQIKVLLVAQPAYVGPILVRALSVNSMEPVQLAVGSDPPEPALYLDDQPISGTWPNWPSYVFVMGPGCYAYQVDGKSFSEVIVFRVV